MRIFFGVLFCLLGGIYGQEGIFRINGNSNGVLHLLLTIDGEDVTVRKASVERGSVSGHLFDLDQPAFYSLLLFDRYGNLVYSNAFLDPGIVFYDDLTDGEKLSGGIIRNDSGILNIKVPYVPGAELQILSPSDKLLFRQDLESIAAANQNSPKAADNKYETILNNGDPQYMIDLLVMGDGYTVNDTAKFRDDVQSHVVDHLIKYISPFKEYQLYFNVHLVQLISEERGADHPEFNPPVYRNTYLDATYNYQNLARLIGCSNQKVFDAAAEVFPEYDKIIVLINDETYGGSGGTFPISYTGYYGAKVLAHEFGHSFGLLLDEYLYSNSAGNVYGCNCDNNSSDPKWKAWIDEGTQGVGTYSGCSYINFYRPTNNSCMMNTLKDMYCPVCMEGITKKINSDVNVIKNYLPADSVREIYFSSTQTFSVDLLFPNNENLAASWYVNNKLETGCNDVSFEFSPPDTGSYFIAAVITDTTGFVLNDPRFEMLDYASWRVNVKEDLIPEEFIVLQNFPNPFNSFTNLKYSIPEESVITLKIYDQLGREAASLINERRAKGWHLYRLDGSSLSSGVYFYSINNGRRVIIGKMVVLK